MKFDFENKIGNGSYSSVFADRSTERAYKLFRKKREPWDYSDEIRRATFMSEVKAYKIAMNNSTLKAVVPNFYGVISVSSVNGENGQDVTSLFLLDCCYCMSLVNSTFEKIGSWDNPPFSELKLYFEKAEIKYYIDASVANRNNMDSLKIIDFATEDLRPRSFK